MIIDCHCHAGKGDGLTGPWDTAAPLEQHMRRAAQAGIDRTVLFAAFHSDYAIANREVGPHRHAPPGPLLRLRLRPRRARSRPRVRAGGRGVSQDTASSGSRCTATTRGSRARSARWRAPFALPVLYDPIGEVSVVELLATEYPDVAFIIPHLGSFADDWRAQLALIDHLVRHPNVYTDTSAIRRFDLLEQAVRRAGARKMLFGSDGPWLHPGVELAKVACPRAAGRRMKQQVLGGNFLRLIARGAGCAGSQSRRGDRRPQRPARRSGYRDPWLADHSAS